MTSAVDFDRLAEKLVGHEYAYLITVDDQNRPHPVPVMPVLDGRTVRIGALGGRRSRANLARTPEVTVMWPPPVPGGYTVIVDGTAEVTDAGELASVAVTASRAVLIRIATPESPGETPCYSDCVDLKVTAREA
ncbi:pyridoxamine 5'-phosphate oxidase family protein [[Mycobacterium] kokjensenii]|uniref:Pyridoxamine 5'-phosphate oxidase family protein n=1 Tax=[Mycobacterium] kokjensenii TaxID=3064287 RepID=A0ABM9L6V4_9MYCO|nr:pyridoxamine 5'-phosphate oxidase family protein [Mycolicibacter sp. MU0083]CAJ1493570.1 pyridoxamine 5'-phosphate oxidase family protein [Mycolicibacter sp. MU0083]